MAYKYDAAIIGGDLRQVYLALIIAESGYRVCTFGLNAPFTNSSIINAESAKDALEASRVIIAPTPFSKDKKHITGIGEEAPEGSCKLPVKSFLDRLSAKQYLIGGNIPAEVVETLSKKHVPCLDVMKNDDIALLNAIATAEGAIAEAVFKSRVNLHQSRILVLGYGRCGKVLALKLHAMGAKVTVYARKKSSLVEAYTNCLNTINILEKAEINDFEFIFNTIPALILDEELLSVLSSDTTIIDISSSPGGVDYEAARRFNLNAHLCLGIPGKISPKSSAKILAEAILPILKERSD